jgi:acyl carrier protein
MNALLSDKEVETALNIVAEECQVPREKIALDGRLRDYATDSLVLVEVMLMLEERFNLTIPDEQLDRVITVADLLELLGETLHPERRAQ